MSGKGDCETRRRLFYPMADLKPCIAISSGEPAGLGPDIICHIDASRFNARLIVVGDYDLILQRARSLNLEFKSTPYRKEQKPRELGMIEFLHMPLAVDCSAGQLDTANASYVLAMLKRSCVGCLEHEFDAMVTAPVQKNIINQAGIAFSGHTEYLANLCAIDKPVMLLAADQLRVALATTHLPLREVADAITFDLVVRIAEILDHDLRLRFGLAQPHIKVCGLNPHAGENGYLGREEIEHIIPAIEYLKQKGLNISGPYPADTVFTKRALEDADVVLAMYHDQGLPVLKHAGFHRAINTTFGLPIIRTSVDHGTGLDLAGRGTADPNSLFAAIESALFQIKCQKGQAQTA